MSNSDSDSSVRVYMREITKNELLTSEQERELGERIQMGDEKARTQMIEANLRLVVKIARDYSDYGVPMVDLISEGNIGLMRAVDKFDPEKGAKLSTYASWWIKQTIKRALANQGKTIRLPIHMVDKIARVRRITNALAEALGRQPSDEELADELGIPHKKLALLKRVSQRPSSLDAPAGDDTDSSYAEFIGDEKAIDPSEALMSKDELGEIDGLLELLDERESKIIDSRFGLTGKKPLTLEEISRDFGVSRERIRQLQNIALGKMKRALGRKEAQPLRDTSPQGAS